MRKFGLSGLIFVSLEALRSCLPRCFCPTWEQFERTRYDAFPEKVESHCEFNIDNFISFRSCRVFKDWWSVEGWSFRIPWAYAYVWNGMCVCMECSGNVKITLKWLARVLIYVNEVFSPTPKFSYYRIFYASYCSIS